MSEDITPDSEEDILVFAEFDDKVDIANYRSIHLLGVDERNPIVQMDGTFFTGTYENSLGTYLFFEDDPNPACEDPLFDKLPEKNLKLVAKTRKLIKMEHAYVTQYKNSDPGISKIESEIKDDDIKPKSFSTLTDAINFFKSDFDISPVNAEGDCPR